MRALLLLLAFSAFFSLTAQAALAASTTMTFSPQAETFGHAFTVDLIIDGHGDKFNAAQATVSPSKGLAIKDLTLGNCNFSFLKTPSMQNPSFEGVIMGSYSTKCTVYTLSLVPIAKENASIALSKAAVRRFGDAANVLAGSSNGSYTLTAALPRPQIPGAPSSQNGLYTVVLSIVSSDNTPVSGATTLLNAVATKTKQQASTDSSGKVQFTNLKQGLYDAQVMQGNNKVGESVINVSGSNHILTFGINLKNQNNNPLLKNSHAVLGLSATSPYLIAGILILGILLGTSLAFGYIKLAKRRPKSLINTKA